MATKYNLNNINEHYFAAPKDSVTTYVNVRSSYSTSSSIIAKLRKGDMLPLQKTGYKDNSYLWYGVQTLDGRIGYVREDNIKTVYLKNEAPTKAQAQSLVDSLIASDRKVYDSLLVLSNLIASQKKNGCNVSRYESNFKDLSEKLSYRQAALKNTSWFGGIKTAASGVWEKMKSAYNSIVASISGIGVIPAIVVVVAVAALIVGSTATIAVYYALKPKYDESKADLKQTEELKEAVAKLSPEKGDKLLKDLEQQVDDAYSQGQTDGKLGGMFSIIKPLAIGAIGFVLVTKFLESQKGK